MKTKLTFLFLVAMLLASSLIHAQAPNSFNYQAVLRDGSGNLITSGLAQMRFTIRTGSANGTVQYQETETATVNQFGLVNHTVGTGTVVSGTMAGVSWASGNKYLQVEVNTGGGFVDLGAQQLVSVPFAMYSANSGGGNWTKNGNNIHNANSGYVGIGTTSPSYPLDLRNASNIEPLKIKGSAQEGRAILLEPGGAGSSYELFIKSTGMEFCENGAGCARLFIANGGNVGIGTGSPNAKLTVQTDFAQGYGFLHRNQGIEVGTYIGAGAGWFGTRTNQRLSFFTNNSAEQVTLLQNGNFGIGTNNPSSRLTAIGASNAGATPTVRGETNGTGGGTTTAAPTGVLGIVNSTNGGSWSAGVRGINNSNQFAGVGVLGITLGTGAGIVGIGGRSIEGNGSFYNIGNGQFTGVLAKGGGSFKIDHPLDPENKYLYHSFVESPDMMNIYNGNIQTDADGRAVVTLPDWFEPLNRDFRYQLTVIGSFSQVMIERKVEDGQFTIRSSEPGVEVSWQVTGIRQDKFANANRIEVEVEKSAEEKGKFFHPELYGKSIEFQAPVPSGPILDAHKHQEATPFSATENK